MNKYANSKIIETLELVKEKMERDLKRQVPQYPRSPFSSRRSDLKNSLRVNVNKQTTSITFDFLNYGIYTIYGTGQERDESSYNKSIFEMPAATRYVKGRFGIRPQYWISLSAVQQRYMDLIEENLNVGFEEFIEKYINDITKI
jgi:hypothetical protein